MTYKQIINQSTDNKAAQEYEYRVEATRLQLESSILETRTALTKAQQELNQAAYKFPINFTNYLDLREVVEDYTRGLNALNTLKEEWFPIENH